MCPNSLNVSRDPHAVWFSSTLFMLTVYLLLSSVKFFFFFYLLINRRDKSKTFTSRLMDQRARLVMMSRQGNPPEELENEKIAEFQLEKKKVRELMNKKLEKKNVTTRRTLV